MNNNLDHLFKKALQDKSCEPPPYIWGNIERQLNKNKHKVALWWCALQLQQQWSPLLSEFGCSIPSNHPK